MFEFWKNLNKPSKPGRTLRDLKKLFFHLSASQLDIVYVIKYKSGTDGFLYSIRENICLVLFRRQYGIFGFCDYISIPKMMGSSACLGVYTVRNV